jgi:hypothetical protein
MPKSMVSVNRAVWVMVPFDRHKCRCRDLFCGRCWNHKQLRCWRLITKYKSRYDSSVNLPDLTKRVAPTKRINPGAIQPTSRRCGVKSLAAG